MTLRIGRYAGGTAGEFLMVAWIVNANKGGRPNSEGNYAGKPEGTTGHIVCNNPTGSSERYCVRASSRIGHCFTTQLV